MRMANDIMTLDRLRQLLDLHGAAFARWPVSEAEASTALMASNPTARALVAEAAAFDRVLAAAPSGRSDHLAKLTDTITGAAARPQFEPVATRAPRSSMGRKRWAALAAMAASLLIGIYGGLNGWTPQGLQQIAELSADPASGATAEEDAQYGDFL
jgi:hypothetical protein